MRLRKDAKMELLRSVPLFAGLSKKELAQVAAIADELALPEGRRLIREGERGREFFVISSGSVAVTKAGHPVATLGPGDFVGEISLVADIPRTATVTTAEPTSVLVITAASFGSLRRRVPSISDKVTATLGQRLAELQMLPSA